MEDSIAAIESGGDDKEHLLKFNVSLKMWEKIWIETIATINAGGDIFIPTTMLEPLKKDVAHKYVEIKELKHKILDNRQVKHLGC